MEAHTQLLTASELATRLRRSRDWVYRRARAGDLPGAIRLDTGWRFRRSEIDAWLGTQEQTHPPRPSGVGHSHRPERRVSPQKAKRKMKVTVKARTQGTGGLEANLFWTDAQGRRKRVRRASPYKSKSKTRRWAEQLLRELVEAEEDAGGQEHATEASPHHTHTDDEHELTFEAFVPRFLAFCESPVAGRRGPNSPEEIHHKRGIIEQHLEPFFGEMPLGSITAGHVDVYASKKARQRSKRTGKPLSASTLANHLGLLRRMLKVAHRWELIARVPEIQLPRKRQVEDFLDHEETRELLLHAEPLFRDLLFVAVRTGMRLGELRELRRGDVDLRRGRIRVERQRTQSDVVRAPKGDKARTIQVPADALECLRKRVKGLRRDQLVFCKPKGYTAPHRSERPAKGGEPWSHKDVYNAVSRGAEAAGIERMVGVHTLRHTFATHAVAAGVPLPMVSRQLGHADVQTTMRYAHHAPELTPGVFDRLVEGYAAIPAGPESG